MKRCTAESVRPDAIDYQVLGFIYIRSSIRIVALQQLPDHLVLEVAVPLPVPGVPVKIRTSPVGRSRGCEQVFGTCQNNFLAFDTPGALDVNREVSDSS